MRANSRKLTEGAADKKTRITLVTLTGDVIGHSAYGYVVIASDDNLVDSIS